MISLTNKNALPRVRIYFLRHSKIVLLFVLSSQMISLTNENTVLLWRRKCVPALKQIHGSFSGIGARHKFGQADSLINKSNKSTMIL